ncbi:AlpA family phage regulatory protein [Alphaproteobacteria bacterium GH1-50]|uniref:AlpA family phage regulatory protein n=2 Tax=Kangsaoukella pontilimi TaxID=2691042 RepID=A0A7C9MVZ6_9RHOB|nr:AlpA family phage regulatory protein [Kangsaoukella pontilimi]
MTTAFISESLWTEVPPTGRLLRPAEVCERVGLSRSQVYELIRRGEFPPFIKLSPGTSAMPEAWLDQFIVAKARDAVSDTQSSPPIKT